MRAFQCDICDQLFSDERFDDMRIKVGKFGRRHIMIHYQLYTVEPGSSDPTYQPIPMDTCRSCFLNLAKKGLANE